MAIRKNKELTNGIDNREIRNRTLNNQFYSFENLYHPLGVVF